MNDDNKIKKWIAAWEKTDSLLAEIKRQELQEEDYYTRNRETLNGLLQYAADNRIIRNSSGLVEQQRLFKILFLQKGDPS